MEYKHQNNYRRAVRRGMIAKMGGKCIICGFDDWRALQLDHIKGGGYKGKANQLVYREILDAKVIPNDYQLLCANCNWIKRYENNENRT